MADAPKDKEWWKDTVLFVLVGVMVTIPAVFLSVVSAGSGHGHYVEARLFYPLPCLLGRANNHLADEHMLLALVQFPLYGVIVGSFRHRLRSALILAGIHGTFLGIAFLQAGW